ncbi:hypothetical protein [Anaerophilus nitritogenes]|uniref:hypothetical protein n=1 Tax=Anaerophilus nitritogenes TaxID=2498136 RepID=UPI00101C3E3E|nr:hypothetical protein [Anaerophilus nitritogenes]
MAEKKQVEQQVTAYEKNQIISSKRFNLIEKDVLKNILKDDGKYTIEQVEKLLDEFLKKEVK